MSVNELGALFSPVTGEDGMSCVYVGKIDMNSWLPDPTESQTAVAASSSGTDAERE